MSTLQWNGSFVNLYVILFLFAYYTPFCKAILVAKLLTVLTVLVA